MMKILKPIGMLALIYCVVGPILLLVEHICGLDEATSQALPITLLSFFFFFYSFISLMIFYHLYSKKSKGLTGYYLIDKTVRLLLSILILLVYDLACGRDIAAFAINLFVLYLVTMVFTSYYCIKKEQKANYNKQVE